MTSSLAVERSFRNVMNDDEEAERRRNLHRDLCASQLAIKTTLYLELELRILRQLREEYRLQRNKPLSNLTVPAPPAPSAPPTSSRALNPVGGHGVFRLLGESRAALNPVRETEMFRLFKEAHAIRRRIDENFVNPSRPSDRDELEDMQRLAEGIREALSELNIASPECFKTGVHF